jgi:hypothetical protein
MNSWQRYRWEYVPMPKRVSKTGSELFVMALVKTLRLMKEIDEAIDYHGGWPGAFPGKNKKLPIQE